MLSPGKYHLEVPREPEANLEWRERLYSFLAKKGREEAREAVRRMCRADLLFYVNAFVFQFNPNPIGSQLEVGPFCTWEFQDRDLTYGDRAAGRVGILQCIEERKDLVVEKSRELGATWMMLLVKDWMAAFHRHKHFLLLSKDEISVDDGTPDSLFGKLEFIHERLPGWLFGKPRKRELKIEYATGSWIVGRASTKSAGVGGRATAIFFDEFSRFGAGKRNSAFEVLRSTADVSKCRIFNSTHTEIGTAFDELTRRPDMRKLVIHWTDHPEKRRGLYRHDPLDPAAGADGIVRLDPDYEYPDGFAFVADGRPLGGVRPGLRSPWYDEECTRRDARAVAMDLDVDVRGATRQFVDPQMIDRLKRYDCIEPLWVGDLTVDPDRGRCTGLVPAPGGALSMWVRPDFHGRVSRGRYVIGCDVSYGQGATPSVAVIYDADRGQQVGTYATAFQPPDRFALSVAALGRLFCTDGGSEAALIWETSGPGSGFKKKLYDLGYGNVFYRVDERKNPPERSDEPGWFSSPQNKVLLVSSFAAALNSGDCQVRDVRILEDCLAFKHDGKGGVEHPREKAGEDPATGGEAHADFGVGAAVGWRMVEEVGHGTPDEPANEEPTPITLAGRIALAEARSEQMLEQWN